jgi:serine/threonine protein kinase
MSRNPAIAVEWAAELVQTIVAGWRESGQPDTLVALDQYPHLRAEKSHMLDLAYEEYVQRRGAGECVEVDKFCARFPEYQESVRRIIEAHSFLEREGRLDGEPAFRWPEEGERVADYLILRRLGRGSFARVYLARNELTEREVVLKVSPLNLVEPRVLGKLDHENVVPILDARQIDAAMLLVAMPYVGASTLQDLIETASAGEPGEEDFAKAVARHRRVDDPAADAAGLRQPYVRAVLKLARELAEGLAYLHEAGVQHRDMKPSNVILSWQGRPIIVDFNLAVDLRRGVNHFGGTLQYMAPEQIRAGLGDPGGAVDSRADLYSFGVILFELLARKHPFSATGDRSASVRDSASGAFARWLLLRQQSGCRASRPLIVSIDPRFERLVFRCLEFDREQRPASARAVANELAKLCRHDPARARRRRRLQRGLAAAAIVLSFITAGAAIHAATRPPLAQRLAEKAKDRLRAGQPVAALDDLEPVVKPGMVNPEGFFLRGVALLRSGDVRSAVQDFGKALDQGHDPGGATSAALAYCYARLQNCPAALAHSDTAISRGFNSAAVYNNRAACRFFSPNERERDLDKALTDVEKALALDRQRVEPYLNQSMILPQLFDRLKNPTLIDRAIDAVREAESRGLRSLPLFRNGANLIMQYRSPLRPAEFETVIRWMREAIALGYDPTLLESTRQFDAIAARPGFVALKALKPGKSDATSKTQLIDPLEDMYR